MRNHNIICILGMGINGIRHLILNGDEEQKPLTELLNRKPYDTNFGTKPINEANGLTHKTIGNEEESYDMSMINDMSGKLNAN